MAKQTKKLELVPASNLAESGAVALFQPAENLAALLGKAKKLTKPPMIKLDTIPVGAVVQGEIIGLADSISPRAEMRGSKLVHMRNDQGAEFLLPLSGVIKKAIGGDEGVEKNVGYTLIIVRQPDGETTKYCAKGEPAKKVFMFDVYLSE